MAKRFYVTTAIDYVNAEPHIGHAYEKIIADTVARWHRLKGEDVFFLTGTDEHGQKIEDRARQEKMKPQEFADKISKKFILLCEKLNISNDDFIRTTDERHVKFAQEMFNKVHDKKEIYLADYEGLYCVGCEKFLTEKDLENGCCPIHKKEPQKIKEKSYFFKMGKYQKKIISYFKKNKSFIIPEGKQHEIMNRLEEPLKDLSVSRVSLKWGIPVPFDEKHVIYVWFDALLNYLSAVKDKKYWPADIHFIGPDILWFHSVIWPSILLSLNQKLPRKIFVHGYLTVNGEKMSKSLGNVVDPIMVSEKYGVDSVRYFLLRSIPLGQDGDFSEKSLKDRHNNELANKLGNLVSRVSGMCKGEYKKSKIDKELSGKLRFEEIRKHMDDVELDRALNLIFEYIDECNNYVQTRQPWTLEGKKKEEILYNLVDSIRIISILLGPFMPSTCEKIRKQFGFENENLKKVKFGLTKSGKVNKADILFKKIE